MIGNRLGHDEEYALMQNTFDQKVLELFSENRIENLRQWYLPLDVKTNNKKTETKFWKNTIEHKHTKRQTFHDIFRSGVKVCCSGLTILEQLSEETLVEQRALIASYFLYKSLESCLENNGFQEKSAEKKQLVQVRLSETVSTNKTLNKTQ